MSRVCDHCGEVTETPLTFWDFLDARMGEDQVRAWQAMRTRVDGYAVWVTVWLGQKLTMKQFCAVAAFWADHPDYDPEWAWPDDEEVLTESVPATP